MSKQYQFETLQIHAGQKPDPVTKATGVPIYLSNAFTFDDADQAKNIFALEEGGYFYSRLSNPTVDVLQQRMAALDGGVGAVAFASGTAAIMGLIMTVCQSEMKLLQLIIFTVEQLVLYLEQCEEWALFLILSIQEIYLQWKLSLMKRQNGLVLNQLEILMVICWILML